MTTPLVVDSSVAVKWIVRDDESDVDAALGLLNRHRAGELTLCAPAHMRVEFLDALWSFRLDADALLRAEDVLTRLHLDWYPADTFLARSAIPLAVTYRLTVYDALFAALANQLDCELVTADHALAASGACKVRLLGG